MADARPSVDWSLVLLLWAVVVGGTLGIGLLFERGRRSRVHRLQETVRALSARDARVAVERQELLESKTGFVRAVSHELRTPLAIMRGIAQLLETKGSDMDEGQRALLLGRLVANSDRLDALLQDLLDVDRLTSRTAHVARQDVRVVGVVEAVLATLDTSGHVVTVDVGEDAIAHATPGHVSASCTTWSTTRSSTHRTVARCGSPLVAQPGASTWPCPMTVRAFPPRIGSPCSNPFVGRRTTARNRGSASGCHWFVAWPSCTAGGPGSRSHRAAGPRSTWCSPTRGARRRSTTGTSPPTPPPDYGPAS